MAIKHISESEDCVDFKILMYMLAAWILCCLNTKTRQV